MNRPLETASDVPMLKMKELVEKTGISKATILYYINVGLLPQPVKKSANVSFYPISFVEKVRFIKQLQSKHRLSLAQIKTILKEQEKGREVTPLIELNEVVFGRKDEVEYNLKQFCEVSGLDRASAKKAIEMQLINPKEAGLFDSEDVAMGKMLKQSINRGFSLKSLDFYPKLAAQIVEKEIEVRNQITKDKSFEDIISITLEVTGIARSFRGYVIDRIFQKRVSGE
ncbi:MerR family transcriptional regulator [bacterium]|nr:MerR family transcriptional regulator [bacterium]